MKNCIICQSNTEEVLDLGQQALANAIVKKPEITEKKYRLRLIRCCNCGHLQLDTHVDPDLLFDHYVWVTGTSKSTIDFSHEFFETVRKKQHKLERVIEIASNDGTFLKPFKKIGSYVLGVDPAKNIAKEANKINIKTRVAYFSSSEAKAILKDEDMKKFDVVIARNVIAHTPNPIDMLMGVETILSEDGQAFIEYHDAYHILKTNQYDSIYHEHYSYFHLASFEYAAKKANLKIIDVMDSPISGGASIVVVTKNKAKVIDKRVNNRLNRDADLGLNKANAWEQFANKAREHSRILKNIVSSCDSKIYGYGSSARSNTMLAFANITNEEIQFIVDNNSLKQDSYTPGTNILIKDKHSLPREGICILLLAWNFSDEIIKSLISENYKNISIIKPLPGMPSFEKVN